MDESEHILLAGSGAEDYALEHGMRLCSNKHLMTQREVKWKAFQAEEGFTTKDAFKKKKQQAIPSAQ